MDPPKANPGTTHRLILSNPMAFSYHVARAPEAGALDSTKTHFKEDHSGNLKMSSEVNKRPATFSGKLQGDHDAYYLALVKGPTGEYNVIPVKNWYNFQKDVTYATLNTEDAEKIVSGSMRKTKKCIVGAEEKGEKRGKERSC